jgi:hypothetical protein
VHTLFGPFLLPPAHFRLYAPCFQAECNFCFKVICILKETKEEEKNHMILSFSLLSLCLSFFPVHLSAYRGSQCISFATLVFVEVRL